MKVIAIVAAVVDALGNLVRAGGGRILSGRWWRITSKRALRHTSAAITRRAAGA